MSLWTGAVPLIKWKDSTVVPHYVYEWIMSDANIQFETLTGNFAFLLFIVDCFFGPVAQFRWQSLPFSLNIKV